MRRESPFPNNEVVRPRVCDRRRALSRVHREKKEKERERKLEGDGRASWRNFNDAARSDDGGYR